MPRGRGRLEIASAEGMAFAGREIRERHLVAPADPGIHLVNLASKPVWRKPLGHCIGVEERPVYPLGSSSQHAVKSDGGHGFRPLRGWSQPIVDPSHAKSTWVLSKNFTLRCLIKGANQIFPLFQV